MSPAARLREAVIATAGPSAAMQAQLEHAAQQMGIDEPNVGEPDLWDAVVVLREVLATQQ